MMILSQNWMLGNAGNNCVNWFDSSIADIIQHSCVCYCVCDNSWQSCNWSRDTGLRHALQSGVEGETPAVVAKQQPCQHQQQQQWSEVLLPTAVITIRVRAFIPIHGLWWSQWLERDTQTDVTLRVTLSPPQRLTPSSSIQSLTKPEEGGPWVSGRSRKCFKSRGLWHCDAGSTQSRC